MFLATPGARLTLILGATAAFPACILFGSILYW